MATVAKMVAADETLCGAEPPYNGEGLLAFVESVAELRLLDGLSDYDAATVTLLVTLNFLQGPRRMAWRIWDMLGDRPQTPARKHDTEAAVIDSMVGILRMVIAPFVTPPQESSYRHRRATFPVVPATVTGSIDVRIDICSDEDSEGVERYIMLNGNIHLLSPGAARQVAADLLDAADQLEAASSSAVAELVD